MIEHSSLCPAFVGAFERLTGALPSGACECGAEAPPPMPQGEEVKSEPELGTEENTLRAPPGETVYSRDALAPSLVSSHPMFAERPAERIGVSGAKGPNVESVQPTTPTTPPTPPKQVAAVETACADTRPATDRAPGDQIELPFDPEPLVEPEPEDEKTEPSSPLGFARTTSQGQPDPNGSCLAQVAPAAETPACVACGGVGKSSKGDQCSPCGGTGKKKDATIIDVMAHKALEEAKAAVVQSLISDAKAKLEERAGPGSTSAPIPAAPPPPPAPPQAPPQDTPAPALKRKRRTKAEIEADKAAKAAAAAPPAPPATTFITIARPDSAPTTVQFKVPPESALKGDVQVVAGTAEVKPGGIAVTLSPEQKAPLKIDTPPRPTIQVVSTEAETKLQATLANHEALIKKLIQERDTYKGSSETWKKCFERIEADYKNGVPAVTAMAVPTPERRIFVGIDPGTTGFESAVDEDMKIVFATPCPVIQAKKRRIHDAQGIVDEVRGWKTMGVDTVLVEAQQAFPKIGSIANFVKGVSKGSWETALLAHGIRFDTIRPITWKKAMGIAGGAPEDVKIRAIAKAQRLFPGVDLREDPGNPRRKKLSSDKAESLLLAVYVARMSMGAAPGTDQWEKIENADAAMVNSAPALAKAAGDGFVSGDEQDDKSDVDAPTDDEKAAALREFGDMIKRGMPGGLKKLAKITKMPTKADKAPKVRKGPKGPRKPAPTGEGDKLRAALKRAAEKGKKS